MNMEIKKTLLYSSLEPSSSASNADTETEGGLMNHSRNFVCGWGAALVETTLVYPVHKLSFRQQLDGLRMREALREVCGEGGRFLYRGLLPPLIQKTSSRSIMFGTFDEYCRLLGCRSMASFGVWHGIAAFMAGTTEAVLCPLERVQVLLQSPQFHNHFANTMDAMRHLRPYGLCEYYRGLSAILARNGTSNVLFFGLREPIARMFRADGFPLVLAEFCSGALLGAFLSTAFFPLNVIKSRMQSSLGGPFPSGFVVFRTIWRERNGSLRRLYLGAQLNFTRSLLSWGITNSAYEILRRHFFPVEH